MKKFWTICFVILLLAYYLGNHTSIKLNKQIESKQQHLLQNIIHAKEKNNYSFHIIIQEKYEIDVVRDGDEHCAYYRTWNGLNTGYWKNNVLKYYEDGEFSGKEECSFKEFEKKIGFSLEELNQHWKNRIIGEKFTKVDYNCISISRMIYEWEFISESENDNFELYVDSDDNGNPYGSFGIIYYQKARKGSVDYEVCYSDDSPISRFLVSNEHFSLLSECKSLEEMVDE